MRSAFICPFLDVWAEQLSGPCPRPLTDRKNASTGQQEFWSSHYFGKRRTRRNSPAPYDLDHLQHESHTSGTIRLSFASMESVGAGAFTFSSLLLTRSKLLPIISLCGRFDHSQTFRQHF